MKNVHIIINKVSILLLMVIAVLICTATITACAGHDDEIIKKKETPNVVDGDDDDDDDGDGNGKDDGKDDGGKDDDGGNGDGNGDGGDGNGDGGNGDGNGDGNALAGKFLCAGGCLCHAADGGVCDDALYGGAIGIFQFLADELGHCLGHAHGLVFQGFANAVHSSVNGGTDANLGVGNNHMVSSWLSVCGIFVVRQFGSSGFFFENQV